MKITDLTVTLFAWENIPSASLNDRNPKATGRSELGLVTISTDGGVEGHAFLGSSSRSAYLDVVSLVRSLKPIVLGQDPLDRERLFAALNRRSRSSTLRCVGAVDVALWDLAGKVAGMPIHQLIGTYRRKMLAYASSSHLGSPEEYVVQALRLKEAGFKAYKIHPPVPPDVDTCATICRKVRDALGPEFRIMTDLVWSLDYPQAVRLGRILEELNFYWYEDPLAEEDMYNYAKLRQKLDIPILATEYAPGGFHAYAPWIIAQATDFLRGDVAVKGGITSILKAAHLAEGFQMNMEVHHGGNSLNNVANLHIMMAIKNCEYFEVLMPDAAHKYGLVKDIEVDREGYVHAIDGAGLGAEIDFDLIRRNTIEVLR